jgi:S1-C subfamily serine protease
MLLLPTALVNEYGEVVGINTAIRAYAEGIGFGMQTIHKSYR